MKRVLSVWLVFVLVGVLWCTALSLAQDEGGGGAPTSVKRYSLWQFIRGGGIISIPIWVCSGLFLALAIENGLTLRHHVIMPAPLIEGFNRNLEERKFQEAYETASRSESFLGRVLTAGLSKLPLGYAPAVQHMQEAGEEETMRLEQRIGYLSLIGVVAPMLGLLGTVTGMIKAFHQIALKGEAVKPGDMATGISEALVTTCEGLIVAIPCIAVYALYRNRVQRLVLEVGLVCEEMMSQFNPATRGKVAAAPAGQPAAPVGAPPATPTAVEGTPPTAPTRPTATGQPPGGPPTG